MNIAENKAEKAIVHHDPALLAKARRLAGGDSALPKCSYIKISYNDNEAPRGSFVLKLWDKDKEGYEDKVLGTSFEATVLSVTKKCSQWDNDLGRNLYESHEFDSYGEVISIVNDNEVVAKGTYRQLRDRYRDLKLQLVVYLLIDNTVVKFFLKGKSIVGFGDYEHSVIEAGSALQAYKTAFKTKKEQNGAVTYYLVDFEKGEAEDLVKTVALSERVREGIQALRDKFEQQYYPSSSKIIDGEQVTVKETKSWQDEIDIAELPF